jgi:hypothetical protein
MEIRLTPEMIYSVRGKITSRPEENSAFGMSIHRRTDDGLPARRSIPISASRSRKSYCHQNRADRKLKAGTEGDSTGVRASKRVLPPSPPQSASKLNASALVFRAMAKRFIPPVKSAARPFPGGKSHDAWCNARQAACISYTNAL